ncbi:AraC family transcriptional regulator [Chitinophaga sp. HK235]|uniref:AraC family transcriptional regulator n=1 Tax=Chitinophaga sp. HK235 TaxID=2952571 RepID=UPI001BA94D70|nr:AraC family transcriptional regulator [Chitinophaga sp. HK235]
MIRKREGFQGQRAIVIPRNILLERCAADPVMKTMYITDIGYYPKAQFHYCKRLNGAPEHILIYCQEGRGSIRLKKSEYPIKAGDCFLIPREWAHAYHAHDTDPWTIYWAHFAGHTADAIVHTAIQQLNGHQTFLLHANERIALFDSIYQQLERGYRTENLLYANMSFWSFLASCIYPGCYHPGKSKPGQDTIDHAIDYMNNHLDRMLTLEQMAQSINLSISHFSWLFKHNTGYSPIEYFNHLKVQKACQYLHFTHLRIKEIAALLGIEDPYYFSRLFTKVMGLSPAQYREKETGTVK